MCRAQFEKQDSLEADALCNKQRVQEPNEGDQTSSDEEARIATSNQEGNGLIQHHYRQPQILSPFKTWKLPDWVNFTYSSVHHRAHQPQRRPPIPFGPNERSFSRLRSMSMDQQTLTQSIKPANEGSSLRPEIKSTERINRPPRPRLRPSLPVSKPVVPHPSPITWDDQSIPDLPYDNPFYTRAIDNVLWLPCNPCGLLNLDDTVDMKMSLTVEVAAGQLGTFPTGLLERISPGETSQISSRPMTSSSETATSPVSFARELLDVDGTEEIELPVAIAKRVQAGEADVEHVARPQKVSSYRGKLTSAAKSTLSLVSGPGRGRRPSLLGPPTPSLLSADGDEYGGRDRKPSIMSALQLPHALQRVKSSDHEMGSRHEAQSSANTVPINASTSRTSLAPPDNLVIRPSRSQNLSTSNAIFREVLAEEEDAKQHYILEEQTEATKSQTNKSWWTSWMFRKLQ